MNTELKSSDIGGGYRYGHGTSYAAPHVAGVIALIKSIRADLVVEEIRNILHNTATDIGPIGWDEETGYGILNATAALELASIFSPTTTTTPRLFWIFGTNYTNFLELICFFTVINLYIDRKRKKNR
jgi:subtilisin family serine protease